MTTSCTGSSFSAEVFAKGGEQAVTSAFYTSQAADDIFLHADGIAEMDVTK